MWGTLRILLEAKKETLINEIEPFVVRLKEKGLWISEEIFQRILKLANESKS